jgi:hypothetical protein
MDAEAGYDDWTQDGILGFGMHTAKVHPELFNCISTALLWSLGDVIAQMFERQKHRSRTHLPLTQSPSHSAADPYSPTAWKFNYARTLRIASFAGLLFAPVTKAWFELLVILFPGEGLFVAFKRMMLDQGLYASCVISSLFAWVGFWESGGNMKAAIAKVKTNYCEYTVLSHSRCMLVVIRLACNTHLAHTRLLC